MGRGREAVRRMLFPGSWLQVGKPLVQSSPGPVAAMVGGLQVPVRSSRVTPAPPAFHVCPHR